MVLGPKMVFVECVMWFGKDFEQWLGYFEDWSHFGYFGHHSLQFSVSNPIPDSIKVLNWLDWLCPDVVLRGC